LEKNLFAADLRRRAQMGKSGFTAEKRLKHGGKEEAEGRGSPELPKSPKLERQYPLAFRSTDLS
jgi:hypothetical protein